MKKALCFALLLALLMCPVSALCEAAAAEPLDFGDFTMDLRPDTPGAWGEKVSNSVLFMAYPLYLEYGDDSSNINVVWTDVRLTDKQLTSQSFLDSMVQTLTDALPDQYAQAGIKIVELEILETGFTQVDGRNGVYYLYRSTLDYSDFAENAKGVVMDVYTKGVMVSGDFGMYTFTGTSLSPESLGLFFDPLLETVSWK